MKEILTVLFRRKWLVISFFIFMVAVPMTLAYVLPPKYEGKATLLLITGREKKPFIPNEKDTRTSFMQVTMEDVGSEVEMLLSRPILAMVADKNHLDEEHLPSPNERMKYVAYYTLKRFEQFLVDIGLKTAVPPQEGAIDRLYHTVNVDFIKRTNIITVKWRGSTPELAQNVVNTLVDAYLERRIKVYGSAYALDAVTAEVAQTQKQLVRMEDKLNVYKSRNSISDIEKRRLDLIEKLSEAESKTKILESLSIKGLATAELGSLTGDTAFLDLSNRLIDAELKRIELSSRYGENDPKLQAVRHEINALNHLLKERLERNLATWREMAHSYRTQLKQSDQYKIEVDRLQREIGVLTQRYQLSKEKESELLTSDLMDRASIGSVRVVEYASLSTTPVFPKKIIILIVSLFLGGVGGVAYAFGFDRFSNRIMALSDIESSTNLPVLASIQEYPRGRFGKSAPGSGALFSELIPLREALSSTALGGAKSTLILSASRNAGAGFVSENIARLMGQDASVSVLLVSFRYPTRRAPWNENTTDLKNIRASLSALPTHPGEKGFDHLIVDLLPQDIENHDFHPKEILELMKKNYRHIFIDIQTERLGMFYLTFVPHIDQIWVVVAYDRTSRHPLLRMLDVIKRHQGNVIGCIFNRRRNVVPAFLYRRFY